MNSSLIWSSIFAILFSLFLSGCSAIDQDYEASPAISRNNCRKSLHVSNSDLRRFLVAKNRYNETRSINGFDILPIISEGKDTVMYIINYPKGWEIISADKRVPAIIASSEEGNITKDNANQWAWISMMASDMLSIIRSSDDELLFSKEDIESNIRAWGGPLPPVDTISTGDPADGHYELFSISYSFIYYDSIDHLMSTQWTQDDPYNYYCPLVTDTTRAPAGCTPVAAAQVLYYLHGKYGVPESFYSSARCLGYIGDYYYEFLNPYVSVWGDMGTSYGQDSNHLVAIMIANAGALTGVHYGNESSYTMGTVLPSFFEEYGYSCSTASYSESSVVTSLMNGQPVIISAHPTGFLGIPDFQHGHTFVIDGYRREQQVSECLYKWVDAHTGQYNDTLHPDYFEIYTGSPQISRIKMNWGWWTQWIAGYDVNGVFHDHEDAGWYSLISGWTTHNNTYDSLVNMTYNFQLL